jgi:beta-lactamase regulating signal transducer with metallopeptidase domain
MTLIESMQASTNVLVQVVNPAARVVALAGAAAAGLAAFRVKNTSVRLSTWRAVLFTALAMPLLGWLLPPLAVPTPAFLESAPQQTAAAEYVPSEVIASQSVVSGSISVSTAHADSKVVVTRNAAVKGISAAGIGEHAASASRVSQVPSTKSDAAVANPTTFSSMRWGAVPWATVAVASYLAVALFFLARLGIGLLLGRRLLRASQKIDEPRVALRLASRAHYSGLTAVPGLAESELISVPVTMGALRSTILLPAGWREWDEAKLDAILAHEVSHVARRDGFTQRLSLLHRAIFWFSPLAWWLDQRLADLAEQASDEAALSGGADRNDYARTLLGFFEALHASPGRVWWQGVAMAKAGQAERHAERQAEERLERILSWKGSVAMGARNMNVTKASVRKLIAAGVVVLAVPVVYLAAAVRPAGAAAVPQHLPFAQSRSTPQAQSSAPTQPVQSAPATPQPESRSTPAPAPDAEIAPPPEQGPEDAPVPPPAALADGIHVIGGVPAVPAIAPVAPPPHLKDLPAYPPVAALAPRGYLAPRAAIAPAIWSGQTSSSGSSHRGGYSYHYGYDDDQRFVIVSGKSDSFTMSGSGEDARHVEKLRKSIQGDFIWFERDEKPYIIRDQATIDRAKTFWEPEEELGKKQEALGAQQEVLGKQEEELGKKMEEVQINVPDMTAALDKLKAKLQKLGPHATMDQIGDLQSEIGDLQSKIGDLQSQAGDAQGKLGEEQGALGEKQGKLGEEQGRLGEQQAKLAEQATRQMKELLDEAIKKGIAQPEL